MKTLTRRLLAVAFAFLPAVAGAAGSTDQGPGGVEYEMKWEYKGVPFKFKLYEAPRSVFKRVSETGLLKTKDVEKELQTLRPLPEQKVRLLDRENLFFYLVAENPTDKEVSFAVAPHTASPVHASIGFDFTCLCNGHIYKIPPKSTWWRIISLQAFEGQVGSHVVLKHVVFAATKGD